MANCIAPPSLPSQNARLVLFNESKPEPLFAMLAMSVNNVEFDNGLAAGKAG
jgi:hypothetical protein